MALSKWPLYQDTDGFKGLHWCVNRRVKLREFKIWKVVDKESGRDTGRTQASFSRRCAGIRSALISPA